MTDPYNPKVVCLDSVHDYGNGYLQIYFFANTCDLKITPDKQPIKPYYGGDIIISSNITDSSGKPINWNITLPNGQTVTGTGSSASATWDGKTGSKIQPGTYNATITASSSDTCSKSESVPISITPDSNNNTCGLQVQVGSSANVANGNLSHSQQLFSSKGTFPTSLTLYYNSLDPHNGSLGLGWSHDYDISLKENSDGSVLISEGNWKYQRYTLNNGTYTGRAGNYSTLVKNSNGTFTLTTKDGQVSLFAANGTLTSIADRNGNTQTFTYSGGNLATVTDPAGRAITFAYDSANHLTSFTDPSGNAYAFSVGTTLSNVTLPDGGTWQYTYDANAFMLTKTDPLSNTTTYTYDDNHRVISSSDPEGKLRSITYPTTTGTVKSTTFTEKDGGTWTYNYDTQQGYLLSKTDPQGGTTSYAYDVNGNRISTTNPDNTIVTSVYDNLGNITSTTDALGQTTSYTYNSFGQVTSTTDPEGAKTSYAYDAKGNLTSLTDSTGAITAYQYDTKGNVSKITNPLGQTISFTYDQSGNLSTTTDAGNATTTYTYDTAGNVTAITDAKGAVTKFVYDKSNRLVKTIDPNGNASTSTYDLTGNKLTDTDANGNSTTYAYNTQNQLIKTTNALGNVTTYGYSGTGCSSCGGGGNGKLTSLTDADNNVTSYTYDLLGRLVKETDPLNNITSYTYDAKGNLISKTDANGATISYGYDANNRLLQKSYPDNTTESYTYDAKGNMLTAVNKNISYAFTYDLAGRMLSSTDSNGRALTYAYDINGNKTQTTYPESSVVSYSYDTSGRLAKITNGGGRTYTFTYDKLGRRITLGYPNGITANYSYDTAGRLTSLEHKAPHGRPIAGFAYTHDKVGNRLSKAEPDGKTKYTYSAIYQLLQAQPSLPFGRAWGQDETYSYDPTGNRLTGPRRHTDHTYGPGNQLLTAEHIKFSYDKNGNLIEKGFHTHEREKECNHHDHDGKKWTYSYDFDNHLIKAETKRDHETITVSFAYDPLGRRIEKKVETTKHGRTQESTVHTYVYDGQALILDYETHQGEHHRDRSETTLTKYVHGPNIDEPLAMTRDHEVYFYHADGLGNIVALTGKRGYVVQKYEYDSFGNQKNAYNGIEQPFTYTGREWDRETELYYYRARHYDPMVGRFIQKDPIGFDGGDMNLYAYTSNNPVNQVDPTGKSVTTVGCSASDDRKIQIAAGKAEAASQTCLPCKDREAFKNKIRSITIYCIKTNYTPKGVKACGYTYYGGSNFINLTPLGIAEVGCGSLQSTILHEVGHTIGYNESQCTAAENNCFK